MKLRRLFSKSPRYLLRCIVTVMLLGGFFIPGLAQNVKLTGTVRSADDNAPLIGATVKSSSGVGVITDADGAESSYGITGCGPKSDGVLDVNEYTPSQAISEYLLSSPTVCGDLACAQWRNRPISQYNQ